MMTDRRSRLARLDTVFFRRFQLGQQIVRTFKFLKQQRAWRQAFVRANRVRKQRRGAQERRAAA